MQKFKIYPRLFLLLIVTIFINACGNKDYVDTYDDDGFKSFIYAYTSGVISKVAPVRVRFTQKLVDADEIGKPVKKGIVSFTPKFDGTPIWLDEQTIEVKPNKALPSDTKYTGTIRMTNLYSKIPSDLKTFKFGFRTLEQHAEIAIEGLVSPDVSDISKQEVVGTIYTADVADAEEVEKMLSATQKNNDNIEIQWSHDGDQKYHHFIIKNVARGKKASEVQLDWNGNNIGAKEKGVEKVEVPSIDDFKLMDVQIEEEEGQNITLYFSDPISKEQDLDGMVYVKDLNIKFSFTIDGNIVKAYPAKRITGDRTLVVERGIKNVANKAMKSPGQWNVTFSSSKPMVRTLRDGVIMPNSNGLIFPFEAIGLNAIDVEVFKIYSNNVLQFLQVNDLDGEYQLKRVGKVVVQKKIELHELTNKANSGDWMRYALDLNKVVNREPNAIYQVRIGFQQSYSTYYCAGGIANDEGAEEEEAEEAEEGEILSFWDRNYGWYSYDERENPCHEAYYKSYYRKDKFAMSNVLASDLGIIAKKGNDNSYLAVVSNILTTEPMEAVSLKFYDYQQQVIQEIKTDKSGFARTKLKRKPYVIVAQKGKLKGYLKINDGRTLSLSKFDVAGAKTQKGIKGMIYGERDVWRPGDTMFLNFILEDKQNQIPNGHPVTMELYDARGQLYSKVTKSDHVEGIYDFTTVTQSEDGTGNWLAKVKVGGATFQKSIRVETVKPNRLKINIDFGKEEIYADNDLLKGSLQVNWLHGAPASDLKTEIKVQLRPTETKFKTHSNYNFDDPARQFSSNAKTIFNQNVNNDGYAEIEAPLNTNNAAPGMLKAYFTSKAFEKGGDFSTDNFSMLYHPYDAYIGVKLPEKKYREKRLDMDKNETISFVVLDAKGKPLANRKVSLGLYKVRWSWWWDSSDDNLTNFSSANHYGAEKTHEVTTNSQGEATWTLKMEDWGRYMVRATDKSSGHCTGELFYAGYPWNEGKMSKDAAAMLSLETEKEQYNVGDNIELKIPMGKAGRALITIENGTRVVETYWMDAKEGENVFKFKATKEMTPNIYAHVSLLQPHAQVENDLPIRLYGIVPIRVEDPSTKFFPIAKVKDAIRPNEKFTVKVSESNKRAMAYTLAIVDEGLLDLTRFKTPDPWNKFYAREALGVKTWDVYDYVMGAYGGKLERILSIGGDMANKKPLGKQKANRFKPVVMHLGPFYLEKGQTKTHELTMPNYVGAVRVMVVAAKDGAYGNFEKSVKVKQPLMVLGTLPRVLGPTEKVKLPVTVFAMEKFVKNATVKIETNHLLKVNGSSTQTLKFNKIGDKIATFDLDVVDNIGVGTVKITATSGSEKSYQEIELDVRNPNPFVTNVLEAVVQAGDSKEFSFDAVGMRGTNEGVLEVSNIPPINLGSRLRYLLRYPHGCIEQTTSSGFPQLYVSRLLDTDEKTNAKIEQNINATIGRLKTFQVNSGGFAYWPGNSDESHWGSNYAGHFLLEAQALGYNVPTNVINNWVNFQRKTAKKWTPRTESTGYYRNDDLMQAYRLYTLALAKAPEWGAMNRLRQKKDLSNNAKWRLAAAYAVGGKTEAAKEMIRVLPISVKDYQELGYSYGSGLRDRAMILETLVALKDETKAAKAVIDISKSLSSNQWHSTQTIAYSLLAIGKYVGKQKTSSKFNFAYNISNKGNKTAGSNKAIVQVPLEIDQMNNKKVAIKNTDNQQLFVRLILSGQPTVGDQTAAANDLNLAIKYTDLQGTAIDPSRIRQGTDFIAEVQISNPGIRGRYDEMALSQVFPSGWEIYNSRMNNVQNFTNTHVPEYQDIRDDRVYSYFDINASQTHIYRVQLNAAYEGRYYLPTVSCSAMYDNSISARQPGQWVEVVSAEGSVN